ncbi:YccF family protein [Neorhizobium galegae]|uniref:YccF family protein n=1 Tax=Neorhizobium galegae TaxID=399 RepID=UPI002107741F|nr:YccF family protein [Neorhizobium galegae]MCQ1776947.1 YccF family protein [Neorhizobium galegae]MCQ1795863.1 YccF family protein [Neorhizobium galegae]
MRTFGNIIWFCFGGGITALLWLLGGLIAAITIIGLPLSRAAFEMAKMSAFPFGKEAVHVRELDGKGLTATTAATGTIGFIVNLIWLFTFGWVLFVSHVIAGIIACVFVITIPFGIQSFKLAGLALWPVGRRVVTVEMARVAREHNARIKLGKTHAVPVSN